MDIANNISLPEPLMAQVLSVARTEHRSIDEVLADAVERYIEERSWANLLNYGAAQAKSRGLQESDINGLIAESRAEQPGC